METHTVIWVAAKCVGSCVIIFSIAYLVARYLKRRDGDDIFRKECDKLLVDMQVQAPTKETCVLFKHLIILLRQGATTKKRLKWYNQVMLMWQNKHRMPVSVLDAQKILEEHNLVAR